MSTEDNKAILRHSFEEVWNQRNMPSVDESISPDSVVHYPNHPIHGSEGFKQYVTMWLSAFPDTHVTIEDMLAEGDKVVLRWAVRGTHQGAFQGIAPTGKQMTSTGMSICRFEGGKIVETWGEVDVLGMMQQLGVMPTSGPAS